MQEGRRSQSHQPVVGRKAQSWAPGQSHGGMRGEEAKSGIALGSVQNRVPCMHGRMGPAVCRACRPGSVRQPASPVPLEAGAREVMGP